MTDKPTDAVATPKQKKPRAKKKAARKAASVFKRDKRQGEKQRYQKKEPAPAKTMEGKHGGKLKRGGNYRNKGGMGRPRNVLREVFRDMTGLTQDELIRRMRATKNKKKLIQDLSVEQLLNIMDKSAKYGVGAPVQVKVSGTGENGEIPIAVIGPRQ